MLKGSDAKPNKPYDEFPLTAHQNGQWCKKIKGKVWFFGVWANSDDALQKYLDEVDEIQAGRDPRRTVVAGLSSTELPVYELCNMFLERQQARAKSGEVSNRHFSDCLKTCKIVTDHFGKFMRAAALRAADFKALRESFPSTWGPVKTANEIQRVRSVFKWAAESELVDRLPNFGPDFKKPSRTMVADKLASLKQGEKKPDSGIPLSQPTQAEAAAMLNISVDSVKQARKIRKTATPEIVAAVERGEITLNAAVATVNTEVATKPATATAEPEVEKKSPSVIQIQHTLIKMGKDKKRHPQLMQIANDAL